jgi:alkaline phosphatase D
MPIRETDNDKIWRKLTYGDLADLVLLDTRYWGRDETNDVTAGPPPALDPNRTLLGDDQADWMEEQISSSDAQWKLLCQQVMVGNLNLNADAIANLDQWHGYPASRNRFIDFLRGPEIENVVILTGDIHSSWAIEIAIDPLDTEEYDPVTGDGSAAVEFVTPAVTSPGIPAEFLAIVDDARPFNPHIKWFDLTQRGYMILDVTKERVQSAWYLFDDVVVEGAVTESFAAAYSVQSGTTRVVEDDQAAPPLADPPPFA